MLKRIIKNKRVKQGSALMAGFIPIAYVTSTKLLYNWPGLSDVINYACTAFVIWWLHEDTQ